MKKNIYFTKAFEYAVRGYSIMPLRRNKLPLLDSWKAYQEKAADEDQIEKWWTENDSANVGIITGKISGITVVDIDMNGDTHVDVDIFPKTFTIKTPTGGYHLYYKYSKEIQQTANTFPQFPHVDIRNDGGYVVAPPSFCDYIKNKKRVTGTYKVDRNFPLAEFPVALFKVVDHKNAKPPLTISKLLDGFNKMEEGDGRNVALTKIAGKIIKLTDRAEWATTGYTLALAANMRFKTPLTEAEVKTIFESIVKKESEKPVRRLNVDLISTEKGEPIVNEKNIYTICKADAKLAHAMRFNIFTGFVETNFEHDDFTTYQRDDVLQIRMYLMNEYPFLARVPHQSVEDVLVRLANDNPVSPPKVWLESLVWDKTARLDTWLSSVYGVPKDLYHTQVGANVMKGLVKRLVHPGSKFDYVLVIEGEQGIKKSTSLKVLGGDWHVETTLTPDNKDFFMIFGGKAIVEFSEGETLSRSESKRLKAVITMQSDRYRVPYDRSPREFPRQCIFMMTTNQDEYLKDETGNRRWLPIYCEQVIDIDWLAKNREQLYAEAYHRAITLEEKTYEFPEDETKAQQEKRQIIDPRTDAIYAWYFTELFERQRVGGVTTEEAYRFAVQKNAPFMREMTKLDAMMIGSIFRSALKLKKKQIMKEGYRMWKYFPTPSSEKLAPSEERIKADPELAAKKTLRDF